MIERSFSGELVGCAQRANHLDNGCHIYAGPCGQAFSRNLYEALGRVSFYAANRGDVGKS